MDNNTNYMARENAFDDFPCDDDALMHEWVIETKQEIGRLRFRVAGIAMAWCNSAAEAARVASILLRSNFHKNGVFPSRQCHDWV